MILSVPGEDAEASPSSDECYCDLVTELAKYLIVYRYLITLVSGALYWRSMSMPIAAISAIASKGDLERTIEQESVQHEYPESYVGYLPEDTYTTILHFVNRYLGRDESPPNDSTTTPNPSPKKSRKRKRRSSSRKPRPQERGEDEEEPQRDFSPDSEAPMDIDDSDVDVDDDDDNGREIRADSHLPTSIFLNEYPFDDDDDDEDIVKFLESEKRRAAAFSELLLRYDDTLKPLSYTTLDAMFGTTNYRHALEIQKLKPPPVPIDRFVDVLVPRNGNTEESFAKYFPIVIFASLHDYYTEKTKEVRDKIDIRLDTLKSSLNDINDQLVKFARGQIDPGENSLVDILTSPDAALSVLQSGRFIINPKLTTITQRVYSSITLDPLFNFKFCPLEAFTTPLPGSILYSVASIFADICGMEYNRRNVANGTIAYANNNTVNTQKKSSNPAD